jgi:hypothetical protein
LRNGKHGLPAKEKSAASGPRSSSSSKNPKSKIGHDHVNELLKNTHGLILIISSSPTPGFLSQAQREGIVPSALA